MTDETPRPAASLSQAHPSAERAVGSPALTGSSGAGTPYAVSQRDEDTIPRGEERGAPETEAAQGIVADGAGNETQLPVGLQAEPALIQRNGGSVELGMVASPGGPVPIGAVARDEEHAQQLMEDRRAQLERQLKREPERLTDEQIDQLDGPTARAVMDQRGYELPRGAGGRTAREALRTAQAKDDRFAEEAPKSRRRKSQDSDG